MQQYSVACGTGQVTFTLPPGMRADIVEPRRGTPVDLVQATEAALREPVAGPSLAELAKPGQRFASSS